MAKYYVTDLHTGETIAFEGRHQLTAWWKRVNAVKVGFLNRDLHLDDLFANLNLTGKDVRRIRYIGPATSICPYGVVVEEHVLRRYTVHDETGRSVDIRHWPASDWEEPAKAREESPNLNGWKRHTHRRPGRSMELAMMRETACESHGEDDELGVYEIPPVRRKAAHAESKQRTAGNDLASWKNTRCEKQYLRHGSKHGDCDARSKRFIDPEWLEPVEEPVGPEWFEPFEDDAA